jgi:eukaryotic-like serine/threonine-protein kinase
MSAIKLFHGEVSEDLLLKERQFEGLRTKLLPGAADFYGRMEGLLAGQSDPKSRAALATAYDELAALTGNIGNKQEALAVYRKAIAVRRELASRPARDPEATIDLARSLLDAGSLQRDTGDLPGAMAAYEEARGLAERLGATELAPQQVRAVLGKSHHRIGRLLGETMGKHDEAIASLEKSRAIRQKLADANPSVSEFQSDLTATLNQIGLALSHKGKPAEALAWKEKTRAISQKLADANPSVTEFESNLVYIYNNIGNDQDDMGKPAEALAANDRALAITQKLADANPSVTEFQFKLAFNEH